MKNTIVFSILLCFEIVVSKGQCICTYGFTGNTNVLQFNNTSNVANAHYYWEFGDGSSSHQKDPVHTFPESGKYLVTLFGRDTVSGCHTYFETWITVNKPSADPCNPLITDSIFSYNGSDYVAAYDHSVNCGGYSANYDIGPAQNFPPNNWIGVSGWGRALFVGRVQYYTADSINGWALKREYYKTRPYNYASAPNYESCSANFEYWLDYQPNGALLHFETMNKNAASYDFIITGLGNPIHLTASSATYPMPYVSYDRYFPWLIGSYVKDNGGCVDSVWKQIYILNPSYVDPPNCAIAVQPQNQTVYAGNTAKFIISTSPLVSKQWQQDAGLGFVNLTNAGPFSGVHTDTLSISNVQSWWDNYHYRCVVSEDQSYCHNTSNEGIMNVTVGINEAELANIKIFPNPLTDQLFITGNTSYSIRVTDVLGRPIINKPPCTEVDMNALSNGIYYLLLINKEGLVCHREKLVKE